MDGILRLKLYQDFVCYRKPMSYQFWETYPLPPLSTAVGFFHHTIGAEKSISIRCGIQGKFKSIILDVQSIYKFDRVRKEKKEKNGEKGEIKGIYLESFNKMLGKSIIYVSNLYAVELTIYIEAKKEYLEKFRKNLLTLEFPSLGRKEDLVRVDSVDMVELVERDLEENDYELKNGIYLSKEKAKELNARGINYRMNFYYEIKDGIRYFKMKDIVYIDNGTLRYGSILYDQEEDKVVDLIGE